MSLLIKALKQAERSHKQSSDLLDADADLGLDDRPPAGARAEGASTPSGSAEPKAGSKPEFSLDTGSAGTSESEVASSERSGPGDASGRGRTTTEPSWSTILDSRETPLPRAAADAGTATPDAGREARPEPVVLALHTAEDDGPDDDGAAPFPPVTPPAEAPRRGEALGLMEMGSLEPELEDAVTRPAPSVSRSVETIALAPSEPADPERPALDFADAPPEETAAAASPPIAPVGPAVTALSPPDITTPPEYETASVVEPAATRKRRAKPAVIAGIIGVVAGGWLGYQALVTPEFDLSPVNDPMMPMPAVAPAPLPTSDGPLWSAAELAILDEATLHGRMVAEGGWIAAAPQDGRVPTAPVAARGIGAPTAAVPLQEGPVTPAMTPPRAAATPKAPPTATPASAEPPVARATVPAARQGGVPAVPPPRATPAPASGSAPATPEARSAGTAPETPSAGPIPEAPLAGMPAVRLKRAMSAAERSALVKTAAYRALRMNRLDDAERLYRDALVRNPLDSDAWIGLASIAAQKGDNDLARQQYERALTIDPNDAVAQAGLLSVTRSEEPARRESRLRNLIASGMNSAGVTFELANALAEQDRWLEAQQAYFDASSAEPGNADYAFNLAVALDRLAQHGVAVQHYRRAIALAGSGPASFDPAQARQRADALEAAAAKR